MIAATHWSPILNNALAAMLVALASIVAAFLKQVAAKLGAVDEKVVVLDNKIAHVDDHLGTVHEAVGTVVNEVAAANGISMVKLLERAEGRRIADEVPPSERTTSEQGYVDRLEEGGRNMGHEGPNATPPAGMPATTPPP